MNLSNTVFVTSAVKESQYPADRRPEIALVGRSNVGKSSLINSLCGRKGLARTSSNPGRTQTLNFYLVDNTFYFVDLPGYGYAKVPLKVREKWGPMIEGYLINRAVLRGVIMIVDSRHEPNANDKQMFNWLRAYAVPTVIVATKFDKVKPSERIRCLRRIEAKFGQVTAYSSVTGQGKGELIEAIADLLQENQGRGANGGKGMQIPH